MVHPHLRQRSSVRMRYDVTARIEKPVARLRRWFARIGFIVDTVDRAEAVRILWGDRDRRRARVRR